MLTQDHIEDIEATYEEFLKEDINDASRLFIQGLLCELRTLKEKTED